MLKFCICRWLCIGFALYVIFMQKFCICRWLCTGFALYVIFMQKFCICRWLCIGFALYKIFMQIFCSVIFMQTFCRVIFMQKFCIKNSFCSVLQCRFTISKTCIINLNIFSLHNIVAKIESQLLQMNYPYINLQQATFKLYFLNM